ncbi:MAG: B-box zinc finger protein [Terriglobales bacterium]
MNCANHPGVPAIAYCRTCGKPLCAACKRDVMGVIYCEQCLAERLKDVHPNIPPQAPAFVPATPIGALPAGPHPAVAGILAGFFPFGVGAVYTGQYAKGLAHLLIFTGLIWGLSSGHMGGFEPVLGIGMGFFVVYQIIDAVRSAHAIRMGTAPPDPFGFNRTFGMVDRPATANVSDPSTYPGTTAASPPSNMKVPTAAVILIGLGVLFLLQTVGLFEFNVDRIWPLFLIGLGVWLFLTRSGILAHGYDPNICCGRRVWSGPVWLITIGGLFLIESFGGPGFGRTWPVLLLVAGLTKLMGNTAPRTPIGGIPPTSGFQPAPAPPPDNPPVSSEVKNG